MKMNYYDENYDDETLETKTWYKILKCIKIVSIFKKKEVFK